jgi:hypothetical protein
MVFNWNGEMKWSNHYIILWHKFWWRNLIIYYTPRFCKRSRFKLRIVSANTLDPAVIIREGTEHSMFCISGKKVRLELQDLTLRYLRQNVDKRKSGAVIFAMHRSEVIATNCTFFSANGFCVWTVQSASFEGTRCEFQSQERSGCVMFGDSSATLLHCKINDCGQHGVCLRGTANLVCNLSHSPLYISSLFTFIHTLLIYIYRLCAW